MYLVHLLDYRYFSRISQIMYYLSIVLLFFTLFMGTDINEAKRWITLPGINLTFQTSDLGKLALIMYLARMLSKKQQMVHSFKEGFWPTIMPVFIICALIAPEDLSSALLLFVTAFLVLFVGRINLLYLAGLAGIGILSAFLAISILFALPKESIQDKGRLLTWKNRIDAFFIKEEVKEVPYQVMQAKIAIAKGGILPNGPGNSTQKNFLPHPYSDFIYAIIIEEYGLVGGALIVFLYIFLLIRSTFIVKKSPAAFGALLAFGLSLSLVLQAMMNMGVSVGILPVTGVTLPLVSMGGSSTIFTSIAFGIILSVSRHIELEEIAQTAEQNIPTEPEPAVAA